MVPYEKLKGEILGQEQIFWFWNLALLHTLLDQHEFSWHPLFHHPTPHLPSATKKSNDMFTTEP
jgi:hypothetical protein